MSDMDWVTCKVMLGGDITNVGFRSQFSPASVPELDILRRIHGEASINEVKYLTTSQTSPAEEKARLLSIYKEEDVNAVYPGRNPNGMPMLADDHPEEDEDPLAEPAPKPRKKSATTVERLAAKHKTAAKPLDESILKAAEAGE